MRKLFLLVIVSSVVVTGYGQKPTTAVPDKDLEGTITANISENTLIDIPGFGPGRIRWAAPNNLYLYAYGGDNGGVSVYDMGAMKGLSSIASIPQSGYTNPQVINSTVACEAGHGYVVKLQNNAGTIYVRLYVVESLINISGETIGAKVKYLITALPVTGINLNPTTTTLGIGRTLELNITVQPADAANKNVNAVSSNPAVVDIIDGKVKGIAAGTATLSVITTDGNKTTTCNITVIPVAATSIALSTSSLVIDTDKTNDLTLTMQPSDVTNKSVKWTSSNTATVRVYSYYNNGRVAGIAPGTAIITATTDDGNHSASCTVRVIAISAHGVSLDKTFATLGCNDDLYLTPTLIPANASNKKVTWTSSNPAVATVNTNGRVSGVTTGTALIIVKTQDGGYTTNCTVTVYPPFYCSTETIKLGKVGFASTTTWQVGSQIWSAPVTASYCKKKKYNSRTEPPYSTDCSKNYFNWCMVVRYEEQLCPPPWRVPTADDFCTLDKSLNGRSNCDKRSDDPSSFKQYQSMWGASYNELFHDNNKKREETRKSFYYWSASSWAKDTGISMQAIGEIYESLHQVYNYGSWEYKEGWNSRYNGVFPNNNSSSKNSTMQLRCVRDN